MRNNFPYSVYFKQWGEKIKIKYAQVDGYKRIEYYGSRQNSEVAEVFKGRYQNKKNKNGCKRIDAPFDQKIFIVSSDELIELIDQYLIIIRQCLMFFMITLR